MSAFRALLGPKPCPLTAPSISSAFSLIITLQSREPEPPAGEGRVVMSDSQFGLLSNQNNRKQQANRRVFFLLSHWDPQDPGATRAVCSCEVILIGSQSPRVAVTEGTFDSYNQKLRFPHPGVV